jgi:uncharacterized membrane protein
MPKNDNTTVSTATPAPHEPMCGALACVYVIAIVVVLIVVCIIFGGMFLARKHYKARNQSNSQAQREGPEGATEIMLEKT